MGSGVGSGREDNCMDGEERNASETGEEGDNTREEKMTTSSNNFTNKNDMNILLISARSLSPKLYSLLDTMHEADTQIAMITETWIQPNRYVENCCVSV